jgi:hypothetical protein
MSEDGLVISSMAYYTAIRACEVAGDWQTALHLGIYIYIHITHYIIAIYHRITALHMIAHTCMLLYYRIV